ncbi:MAG: DNA (cytosine-5-)-methyltransferase [Bacteroidales bacterium]|nr:DNA (cytosine-5-)-methyltransferase [Bacteroidales bacterium]
MKTIPYEIDTFSEQLTAAELPIFTYGGKQTENQLSMLSLFSGCGGMDLGFEGGFICHKKSVGENNERIERKINENWVLLKRNKFRTIFANDILPEAVCSWTQYMRRFNTDPWIYHTDSIVDLVKAHHAGQKIFPDHVDIVTGGFPCQDFSVAGKRKGFESDKSHDGTRRGIDIPSEETRGKLYYWMKQVIDITKPNIFIAENVKGLVSLGDVRHIIQQDFASADGDGYIVLPPQILHAGNFGVPETRERVIFIGIRRNALSKKTLSILDSESISEEYNPYPSPTHNYNVGDKRLPPPVTCRDVFEGLKEPDIAIDLSQRYYSRAKYMGKHCQGQSEIHLDGLGPTIRSEHHGNIEFRRLSEEHGGRYLDELSEGLLERRLTPRECALIQTFPPDYPFITMKSFSRGFAVNQSGAYKVIGNAVPPMLAYNIAIRIQELWPKYFG